MHSYLQTCVDEFRHRLAHIEALPQLTILGLFSGIFAAGVIILFRLAIELPLSALLPAHNENFEDLSSIWHFALPFIGAIAIGIALQFIDKKHLSISASHVLDRLHRHQGRMPLKNLLVQFFAGIACLLSGQSVGREGPAVHLGAGAASQLGQWLKLPNNSLRPLIGCGVAAAIAASFNTPVAGVIFAMEVILMEYTIVGFLPIILASVTGAVMARMVFGHNLVFESATTQILSLWELPFMALSGLVIAVFAALFIRLQILCIPLHRYPITARLTLAGFVTGIAAIYVPEIMGVGYDTISATLNNNIGLTMLMVIISTKLLITAFSLGLGMPGGVIGPTLFLGACIGAAMGIAGHAIFPELSTDPGFYALLGMSAMMAAVINAPLAALITVLELTGNPNALFPSMLMIVVACLFTRQAFNCASIFQSQLIAQGKPVNAATNQQLLSRAGVSSIMSSNFAPTQQYLSRQQAQQLLSEKPRWLLIEYPDASPILMRALDLATLLTEKMNADSGIEDQINACRDTHKDSETLCIDLLEIPAKRWETAAIDDIANLYEAHLLMQEQQVEALYVCRQHRRQAHRSITTGIITRDALDNFYQSPQNSDKHHLPPFKH